KVIVGAAFQAFDAIAYGSEGGEDDHRRRHPGGPYATEQCEAVEAGEHAVEYDQVERRIGRPEQAVAAFRDMLDRMALLLQPAGEIGGGLAIVFDEEDLAAHPFCSRRRLRPLAPPPKQFPPGDGSIRRADRG